MATSEIIMESQEDSSRRGVWGKDNHCLKTSGRREESSRFSLLFNCFWKKSEGEVLARMSPRELSAQNPLTSRRGERPPKIGEVDYSRRPFGSYLSKSEHMCSQVDWGTFKHTFNHCWSPPLGGLTIHRSKYRRRNFQKSRLWFAGEYCGNGFVTRAFFLSQLQFLNLPPHQKPFKYRFFGKHGPGSRLLLPNYDD